MKRADNAYTGQKFPHNAVHTVHRELDTVKITISYFNAQIDQKKNHRHHHKDDRGDGRIEGYHHDNGTDTHNRRLEKDTHQSVGELLNLCNVVGQSGNERAAIKAIDVRKRKMDDFLKQIRTESAGKFLGDRAGQIIAA